MLIRMLATSLTSIVITMLLGACHAEIEEAGGEPPRPNSTQPDNPPAANPEAKPFAIRKTVEHGRIEDHAGLRVIRLWGSPQQRGHAHGELVGPEAVDLMRREIVARFSSQKKRLEQARSLLPLMVGFPKTYRAEIHALFTSIQEQGVDLTLPQFGRDLDEKDALLINAMDLIVQMGCSGFTVWGDQVEGGGVLTARNFDWPLTGPYLLESCCLMVQHPEDGEAFATVTWPGYVGAITGVNERGVAVFLHYGDAEHGMPRPGSYPTATAARGILRQAEADSAFEIGRDMLGKTCPPGGYLTRVVRPDAGKEHPARVFEADRKGVTHREAQDLCVVTNHFLSRTRENGSGDSVQRWKSIRGRLSSNLTEEDRKVSVAEAWSALTAVERDGSRFGTLHSLVFRHEPWVFELALGKPTRTGGVRAAPSHGDRYRLTRDAVFADVR